MQEKAELRDVYQRITDRIIAELEEGARPWFKPWSADHMAGRVSMPLRSTGEPYRGVNVISLWMTASVSGFACPYWFTFRQAQELGANVRKGEKGTLVVYANRITKTETDAKGEEVEREIPYLKGYTVFNGDQIDGLPARFTERQAAPQITPAQRIEAAEQFFRATGATLRHGGNRAYFAPALDVIQMPPFESFRDAESYTATLAHEFIHWTGHYSRLAREFTGKFGSEKYAEEELCAELGSAFLCADLAITPETRPDHAAYIGSWLKALKGDKRLIFKAAAHAQRAADHLHSYSAKPAAEATVEATAPAWKEAPAPKTSQEKQAVYEAQRAARGAAWVAAQTAPNLTP